MLATRALRVAVARTATRTQFSTPRSVSTLVLADHDNSSLGEATLSAITASKQLGGTTTVLVAGSGCSAVAEAAAKVAGVDSVCLSDTEALEKFMPEAATGFLCDVIKSGGYTHVIGTTSTKTKAVLPRVAALMDVQPVTDVIGIESEDTFTRPIYAGNAIATVKSSDSVKLVTVRPTNFDKAAAEGGSATVSNADASSAGSEASKWISQELSKSDRPDLQSASVVISGGRAMKSGENFGLLDPIADKLKAAVGASRAAVDAGFVPNDMQIGQTGKVVAPDLYIAVGISGAIQHLAGMKDSKVIVAINKDPDAPIFQVADYGLVADLFTTLPELDEKLPGVL